MKNFSSALLLLTLTATVSFGQVDTGIITGRVSDSSGALVPNAQSTVVNTETNFTSDSRSNTEGLFRVPSLRPGPYRITVTANGFKSYVRDGVDLRVGDNLEVNAPLEVGGASFSARKEFTLKERLHAQLRFDFQNPFKWYNWGNPNTTADLKNVVAGTNTETSGNLFGKISTGGEATTVADGGCL